MRGLVGIALVAACGGSPRPTAPPTPVITEPPASPKAPRTAAMPRPDVDVASLLPSFSDVLRWPLGPLGHAAFEPHFAIAGVFADALDWRELCARGVHKRVSSGQRDQIAYLQAWCSAAAGDADGALTKLLPLQSSTTPGLAAAIRIDIPNIIANTGDADDAEGLVSKHRLPLAYVDTLAATYIELGKPDDARELNHRALNDDHRPSDATRCIRLVRDMVLNGNAWSLHEVSLQKLGTGSMADPTCSELMLAVQCAASPTQKCSEYFYRQGLPSQESTKRRSLFRAYLQWPERSAIQRWLSVADDAVQAIPLDGAIALARSAYTAALNLGPLCSPELKETVRRQVEALDPSFASNTSEAFTRRQELRLNVELLRECAAPPRRLPASSSTARSTRKPSPPPPMPPKPPAQIHVEGWRL